MWSACLGLCLCCLASLYLTLGALSPGPLGEAVGDAETISTRAASALTEAAAPVALLPSTKSDPALPGAGAGAAPAPAPATITGDLPIPIRPGSAQSFQDRTAKGEACPRCPEMVVAPAGAFTLGSDAGEGWRDEWQKDMEGPPVKVTIAQPFAVGRFSVTFDEWAACVGDGGCATSPSDNGWGRGNRPVINVTWDNAAGYVTWLSRKTGKPYRLLSEAEREYVARAGTTTPFWFGASPSPSRANYLTRNDASDPTAAPVVERTLSVTSFEPNPWGLFNVHGNVWDWTADCWNESHQGHPGNTAPRQTGNCNLRVLKGGSWLNLPKFIRSAARSKLINDFGYRTVGFRVARTIADAAPN